MLNDQCSIKKCNSICLRVIADFELGILKNPDLERKHEKISYSKFFLKKFKPQGSLIKNTWSYDTELALNIAVSYGVSDSVANLKHEINNLPNADDWCYVRGHDAVNIFTAGLLSEIGRGAAVDDARVDSLLRVGIEEHEYQASSLYNSLNNWYLLQKI